MPSEDKPKTGKCALCGVEREEPMLGMRSDHLRTVYVTEKRPVVFDAGYYRPRRLTEDEKRMLQRGEQYICTGRAACRERQKAKYGS